MACGAIRGTSEAATHKIEWHVVGRAADRRQTHNFPSLRSFVRIRAMCVNVNPVSEYEKDMCFGRLYVRQSYECTGSRQRPLELTYFCNSPDVKK